MWVEVVVIVVPYWKVKRPGCLFSFQIRTTTKRGHLVFSSWFLVASWSNEKSINDFTKCFIFQKMFQYSMNGTRPPASIPFDVSLDLRNVWATRFMHVALNMWMIHIIWLIISMNSLSTQKNWRKWQQRYEFLLLTDWGHPDGVFFKN